MTLKILILGVNGFIGSNLSEHILAHRDWEIYGMDIQSDKLGACLDHSRFHFVEGDILINREWIEYHVKKCDLVMPLVAIATPATYVERPLDVFELDFEANLDVIRYCVRYGKRVLFPSTSEVYGMSDAAEFDEEETPLVMGPIRMQRWIYACSKQLLDRVIYAYGQRDGLPFTLFRPFNWIGPRLDNIWAPKEGSSRVLTQFIGNIIRRSDIYLVDGGSQRRCFLFIDDAVDALIRLIENRDGCADGQIFNIGSPENELSIRELAEELIELVSHYPGYEDVKDQVKLVTVEAEGYYGKGYQDIQVRVPSIRRIADRTGWRPSTPVREALTRTLDYYLLERHTAAGRALLDRAGGE